MEVFFLVLGTEAYFVYIYVFLRNDLYFFVLIRSHALMDFGYLSFG